MQASIKQSIKKAHQSTNLNDANFHRLNFHLSELSRYVQHALLWH